MGIFGYEPVDLALNSYNNRQAREQQFKAIKDTISNKPELGNNLEEIVNKFGNILPRDVMVGSALMGFTVDNPELSSLVRRQIELDNEKNEAILKKSRKFW